MADTLPTSTMLILSTAHISEATAGYLQHMRPHCYNKGDVGFFLMTDAQDDDPADLAELLRLARFAGFEWIMLDRDALELASLPTFEW